MKQVVAVLTVLAAIIGLWYAACVPMNIKGVLTEQERAGAQVQPPSAKDRRDLGEFGLIARNSFAIPATWEQARPRLPAPHQVAVEMWKTTVQKKITSKRSLIYHAWVTLSATMLGFVIGTALGILLAVGIVHSRVMDLSVMPWAIGKPDDSHHRPGADDHRCLVLGRDPGNSPQGGNFSLSEFLSGRRGHGQRAAQPGCDAVGPVANL